MQDESDLNVRSNNESRAIPFMFNGILAKLKRHKSSNAQTQTPIQTRTLPIPVQPFPIVDDFTFESEKEEITNIAEPYFRDYERHFIQNLSGVSKEILGHNASFFSNLDSAMRDQQAFREYLKNALDELLACSPKKIMAEFQKKSLEAGWAYVRGYNQIVDELASRFPRCRAGIFSARLKYSDVIQISDEILTTLRTCQTLMDDLQRRYELLESLQNNLLADMEHTECEKIVKAAKETFADNKKYGASEDSSIAQKIISVFMQPITALGDAMSLPTLQIQGQMQRTERIMVFFATADMFRNGWIEWQNLCREIIEPNLRIMFELKRDFFKNQMLCLCDIVSYNGYSLQGLSQALRERFLQE